MHPQPSIYLSPFSAVRSSLPDSLPPLSSEQTPSSHSVPSRSPPVLRTIPPGVRPSSPSSELDSRTCDFYFYFYFFLLSLPLPSLVLFRFLPPLLSPARNNSPRPFLGPRNTSPAPNTTCSACVSTRLRRSCTASRPPPRSPIRIHSPFSIRIRTPSLLHLSHAYPLAPLRSSACAPPSFRGTCVVQQRGLLRHENQHHWQLRRHLISSTSVSQGSVMTTPTNAGAHPDVLYTRPGPWGRRQFAHRSPRAGERREEEY
ncbi:hypothetical protein B0H10DRAFT_1998938 [Mycena sp. CBHHK59/15]|nr:hypothetical protein B0H10DRAFT_1998938 [Mycena sp. CBHHK59/15]